MFCCKLSCMPPTVGVIISKISLKQGFIVFGRALPKHCFLIKNVPHSPLPLLLYLSKTKRLLLNNTWKMSLVRRFT